MRRSTVIKLLHASVAIGAIVLASSAHAACSTTNGVVTCTDASTTDQVNAAINRTPPPSVTLVVAPGATVVRAFTFFNQSIGPNAPPFSGAIGYTNDGIVGTPAATVDFRAFGDPANTSNSFTLNNRATQNGVISAQNMGGAITATNSGTVTGRIDVLSTGPIAFTNTGTIGSTSPFFFQPAVTLNSSRLVTTFDADGTQRSTTTGGAVTAAIGGTIGLPASGSAAPRPQDVSVRGVGGADVTVTGTAGSISAVAGGGRSANLFSQTLSGQTFTRTQTSEQSLTGSDARVTIANTGRVSGVFVISGAGPATAIIDGAVGTGTTSGSVNVSSNGQDSSFRSTTTMNINIGVPSTSSSSNSNTATGKAALVDIGSTGRASGSVSAFSNAGPATVRIAGVVGSTNLFGSVQSNSSGINRAGQSSSTNRADNSFDTSSSSTEALSGGAALITVGATGDVFGAFTNVSAFGNGDQRGSRAWQCLGELGVVHHADAIVRIVAHDYQWHRRCSDNGRPG